MGKLEVFACLLEVWHYLDSLVAHSSTQPWPNSNNSSILVGLDHWLAPQGASSLAILLSEA